MRLIGLNSWLRGSLTKSPSATPFNVGGSGALDWIEKLAAGGPDQISKCHSLQCVEGVVRLIGLNSWLRGSLIKAPSLKRGAYRIEKGVTMCIFVKKLHVLVGLLC